MDFIGDVLKIGFQVAWIGLFFTGLGILFLAPLVMLLFTVVDIFNRDDIAGGKLVWTLIVLLVPFVGMAIYWLSKPASHQASLPRSVHTPVAVEEQSRPAERRAA